MAPKAKSDTDSNGRKVGADGNQKIDSMMEKPESTQQTNGHEKKEENTSTKREKEEGGDEEERPSKGAKKDENHESVSSANGDAEKAKKPASEKQAQILKPGTEEEMQGDQEGAFKVLERGHIFFFYRPKVQSVDEAEKSGKAAGSIDDVQNTHMLLAPQASESSTAPAASEKKKSDSNTEPSGTNGEKAKKQGVGFRLIRLGKKRLPAPEEAIKNGLQPGGIGGNSSEAIWACVSDIGANSSDLTGSMGEERYNTRTRGERYVGASRPVGRGWYALTLQETDPPSSRSVKLIYALSHPSDMGDVQTELGLSSSGCIAITMRNPTTPSNGAGAAPVGLDDSAKVQMSDKEMQDTFGGDTKQGGTRYARPENVQLLDREGVELLLTKERAQSSSDGASKGAGQDQADALKSLAEADTKRLSVDDVFAELQMNTNDHPPEALQGDWI